MFNPGDTVSHIRLGACAVLHVDGDRLNVEPATPIANPANIPGIGTPWVEAADVTLVSRRDPATVALDDLTPEDASSWCTECGECHLDANDENSHYEVTGHRATRSIGESFAVRRAIDLDRLAASTAAGMREALDARAVRS
jgi:hypothetical protein